MADQLTINVWSIQAQANGLVAVGALTIILLCWIALRARRRRYFAVSTQLHPQAVQRFKDNLEALADILVTKDALPDLELIGTFRCRLSNASL